MVNPILVGLMVVAGLGAFVWLLIVLLTKKPEESNEDIILNFSSHETHGRAIGVWKESIKSAGGQRQWIRFTPKDVDLAKLKAKNIPLRDEEIIVNSPKLISCPRGTLSADTNISVIIPDNPQELDEAVKNTPLGIALQFLILQQNYIQKRMEIYEDKITNRDALLKEIGDAEMSEELLQKIKGFNKDLAEMMLDSKDIKGKKDTPPYFGQGTQPHG